MRPTSSEIQRRDRPRDRHARHAGRLLLIAVAALLMVAGCGSGDDEGVPAFTSDQLTALPAQDWITNGGTVFNQRYSPLEQINARTSPI